MARMCGESLINQPGQEDRALRALAFIHMQLGGLESLKDNFDGAVTEYNQGALYADRLAQCGSVSKSNRLLSEIFLPMGQAYMCQQKFKEAKEV